jgi:vitamin-K-epoxide reductase (warfarin-sensitive)
MAQMRGVETAAEKSDKASQPWRARNVRKLTHLLIVSPEQESASITSTMRFAIAFLALAGAVVASFALRIHYSTETEPCSINEKWDCGIVNHSPYAEIFHIPVAAIGIAGYIVLGGLALARRRNLVAVFACVGLGFSLYLTGIERYVLEVYCLYCVTSLAIIGLLAAVSLLWVITTAIGRHRAKPRLRW